MIRKKKRQMTGVKTKELSHFKFSFAIVMFRSAHIHLPLLCNKSHHVQQSIPTQNNTVMTARVPELTASDTSTRNAKGAVMKCSHSARATPTLRPWSNASRNKLHQSSRPVDAQRQLRRVQAVHLSNYRARAREREKRKCVQFFYLLRYTFIFQVSTLCIQYTYKGKGNTCEFRLCTVMFA